MPVILKTLEDQIRHQLGSMMFQALALSVERDELAKRVADLEAELATARGERAGDDAVNGIRKQRHG